MKLFLILACLCVAASAAKPLEDDEYQFLFTKWVAEHGKSYDHDDFFHRFSVFKTNLNMIMDHNEKNASWTMGMNEFGDLTWEEFYAQYTGYNDVPASFLKSQNVEDLSAVEVGDSVDWDAAGAVTTPGNQGQCGSCWAWSTAEAIESLTKINGGDLTVLSKQQLVDCAGAEGNHGCEGGLMDFGFEYTIKAGGLCTEASYPYTGRQSFFCKNSCTKVASITGYKDVERGSESALMAAVTKQPVSIAIEADQMGFQFYRSGIFSGRCGEQLDHGVLLVGYGTGKMDYWKIKNSWGATWGEHGYIRLARGKNMCGLTNSASYPTSD